MTYKELINLGFVREDMNDEIDNDNYGYPGFTLKLELYGRMCVECCFPALDKLSLYIPKPGHDNYNIIPINDEILLGLVDTLLKPKL